MLLVLNNYIYMYVFKINNNNNFNLYIKILFAQRFGEGMWDCGFGKQVVFQNIFPLAKVSFAKGKMLGAGRHPTGPEWRE